MGLSRQNEQAIIFQQLVNIILAGQQQHQEENALARLEKLAKDSSMVVSLLNPESVSSLLRYCRIETE